MCILTVKGSLRDTVTMIESRKRIALLLWVAGSAVLAGTLALPNRAGAQRALGPDVEALVNGEIEFALDLYSRLAADGSNLVFSPASLHVGLAMTHLRARGKTAQEMERTLHLTIPREKIDSTFAEILDLRREPYLLRAPTLLSLVARLHAPAVADAGNEEEVDDLKLAAG